MRRMFLISFITIASFVSGCIGHQSAFKHKGNDSGAILSAQGSVPSHIILINPFKVPVGREEAYVKGWKKIADYMRQQKGFVSTKLHKSLSPKATFRFINVAVWESAADFKAVVGSDTFKKMAKKSPFSSDPALYEVVAE